jgi:acetylornithine/N-succinyldiaminopimelate aminotransferase
MEGALKAARRYHWARGNPERVDVIGFSGAFHGRTYAAVNAAGNPKYLEGFGPALPGYVNLPFGDHDALKAAIGPTTAAVLVEPVQGEGGVRALPVECLTGLRRLCDAHGILLIYDEVQCGMGRSGKLFAHDWAPDARPDIMAAAKGVGGGFPFGAFMTTEAVGQYMVVGTHGTTYGGNPLAMAVGNTVFDIISDEAFLEGVRQVSGTLTQGLKSLADSHADLIEPEERGKGLLRGLRFKANPKAVQTHAREHGLLVGVAGENVLRLAPPLIITEADVREAVGILDRAITAARPELVN